MEMKRILSLLTAVLVSVQISTLMVHADDAGSLPTEDPDYVEQSLEDYMNENPDYESYPDVDRYAAEAASSSETMQAELCRLTGIR